MKLFIPLVGEFENIGDTLHRSVLLDFLREGNDLHLFVGGAPASFLKGLHLDGTEKLYSSGVGWYLRALTSVFAPSAFIYNPGMMTGGWRRIVKELLVLPLTVSYRLRGRQVLKVGVELSPDSYVHGIVIRAVDVACSHLYWRTHESYLHSGRGSVIPDLGFYRYSPLKQKPRYIAVSLRHDRPFPNKQWFDGVAEAAKRAGLVIIAISQVRKDNIAVKNLVDSFRHQGCEVEAMLWEDNIDHATQEAAVNVVYADSKFVISDRLHVLINAANQGALPLCITNHYSVKAESHFAVIGYKNVAFDSSEMSAEEICNIILSQDKRIDELNQKMGAAVLRLATIKAELLALIRNKNSEFKE